MSATYTYAWHTTLTMSYKPHNETGLHSGLPLHAFCMHFKKSKGVFGKAAVMTVGPWQLPTLARALILRRLS